MKSIALAAALPLLLSCYGVCAVDCALAISIKVTDAGTHAPIDGVTVTGATPSNCFVGETETNCGVGGASGHYELTVSAPGYQSQNLSIDVADDSCAPPYSPESWFGPCCSCGYVSQAADVQLTPN
jgi:hypothetical protein